MGEYFESDLVVVGVEKETIVIKIWLRLLPRVGENIQTLLPNDKSPSDLVVKSVWHLAGDEMTGHRISIYAERI